VGFTFTGIRKINFTKYWEKPTHNFYWNCQMFTTLLEWPNVYHITGAQLWSFETQHNTTSSEALKLRFYLLDLVRRRIGAGETARRFEGGSFPTASTAFVGVIFWLDVRFRVHLRCVWILFVLNVDLGV